jgi:hypothetical protein
MEQLLINKKETSGCLKISPRSVDYLIVQGVLNPVRIGRRVLLKSKEVRRIAERGFHGRLNTKSA